MTNELSMQELLDQQEQELNKVQVGQTITGKISRINNDELVLDLDYGFDGVIKIEELNLPKGKYASEVYNVGDSKKLASVWEAINDANEIARGI